MHHRLFHALLYTLMGIMGVLGVFLVLWSGDWTRRWMKFYARSAMRFARLVYGIETEIRGPVPTGDVLIAAKHQSMFDVLIIYQALPEARFVMKKSLLWVPVFGVYAWRTGAVPIDRRPRHGAAEDLAETFRGKTGQIVIYPQGTRVPPGKHAPYRRGIVRVADATHRPIVPAATNAGVFWGRDGKMAGPGTTVVEFFESLDGSLASSEMMEQLETQVEAATDALVAEALETL
ncbi:MAG: lysophospholipid acyltransferase family protein [Pseudomonadota bacterium]